MPDGGGPDYVGGPGAQGRATARVRLQHLLTDNGKNYYGSYINDDWKVTPKLTVNLGLRWDFFGLVFEHHGAQANFVPGGPPTGSPLYLIPGRDQFRELLFRLPNCFTTAGTGWHRVVIGDKYGKGLGNSQKGTSLPVSALPIKSLRSS